MNPFDLPGPEFLGFYLLLFVTLLALGAILRWVLRLPGGEPSAAALDLNPYEIAYLAGGEQRVAEATIAQMVREGTLAADASERRVTVSEVPLGSSASELNKAIHAAARRDRGISVAALQPVVASIMEPARCRLVELGLLVGADQNWAARLIPTMLALCAPLVGVIKIGVGLSRDKPVMFLVILCVISAFIAIRILARPVFRTRRGDRALDQITKDNAAMKYQARERIESLAGSDLMVALGLFGMGILVGGPLGRLEAALRPRKHKSTAGGDYWPGWGGWGTGWFGWGGWGTGCGVSCGGSSCGGGGCGGGCGGSGCGGCGSG